MYSQAHRVESYLYYFCRSINLWLTNTLMEKYSFWVYIVYIVVMVAIIISVDFLFFKHYFWARLFVNIGIVLVFLAVYLRFLK